jgi:hypothetical protein
MKKFLLNLVIFITFIGTIYGSDWGTFSITHSPSLDVYMDNMISEEDLIYIEQVQNLRHNYDRSITMWDAIQGSLLFSEKGYKRWYTFRDSRNRLYINYQIEFWDENTYFKTLMNENRIEDYVSYVHYLILGNIAAKYLSMADRVKEGIEFDSVYNTGIMHWCNKIFEKLYEIEPSIKGSVIPSNFYRHSRSTDTYTRFIERYPNTKFDFLVSKGPYFEDRDEFYYKFPTENAGLDFIESRDGKRIAVGKILYYVLEEF